MVSTERLELVPLKYDMLKLLLCDIDGFNSKMNCKYMAEPLTGAFADIVSGQLKKTEADIDHYQWHTFWMIMRKQDRVIVGSIDFKDVPDGEKTAEIGYGLAPEFEHKGYMTEAVAAFCRWGFDNGCRRITAETERNNVGSQRVLARCGFKKYAKADTVWWELYRDE